MWPNLVTFTGEILNVTLHLFAVKAENCHKIAIAFMLLNSI